MLSVYSIAPADWVYFEIWLKISEWVEFFLANMRSTQPRGKHEEITQTI